MSIREKIIHHYSLFAHRPNSLMANRFQVWPDSPIGQQPGRAPARAIPLAGRQWLMSTTWSRSMVVIHDEKAVPSTFNILAYLPALGRCYAHRSYKTTMSNRAQLIPS